MARWRPLPAELDPVVVEFVGKLRRLKDESGWSLQRLSASTGYSASSWERYLGGRLMPPWEAVEKLAAAVGADMERLLARWEAASDAWRPGLPADPAAEHDLPEGDAPDRNLPPEHTLPGGATPDGEHVAVPLAGSAGPSAPAPDAPGAPATAAAGTGRRPVTRLPLVVTAVVSAVAGAAVGALAMHVAQSQNQAAGRPAVAKAAMAQPIPYACTYVRRGGLWYAGNSTTRTDQLEVDKSGPEVAELQCLLQHAGFSPGGVDGNFGPLTEAAVIAAQKAYHLDIDGQVGPRTWAALRR